MEISDLRVEDICTFIGGSQPPKSEFIYEPRDGYVRFIQTRDYKTDAFRTYILRSSTKKFCDDQDIMIGRYGPPIFQICRGLTGAYNVALMKAKPKKGIDNEFLYYFLKQDALFRYIDKLSPRTGGQTGVDVDGLNKYPVRIPKLEEDQKNLVASLTAIDAKISLNNRINAELEAMAKTLYDYWFVQFDFPDENGKPYKSSGGKMEYNPTLKRHIPAGWNVRELGDELKTTLGGTPSTKNSIYWDNADICWLNSGEIANFPIVDSEERITKKGIDDSAAELLPKGSVVISIVRHIRVSVLAIDSATNQSVVGIYETEKLKHSFLHPYLSREISRLMSLRTGAQQPHINKGEVDASPITIPAEKVLERYYQAADTIYKKIMTNAFENQQLAQLRDWLLPMLMNGQVKVA